MSERETIQGLAELLGWGRVERIDDGGMADGERGYSGAELARRRVHFEDGRSRTVILKRTDRKERCAMMRLTAQKQCAPAAFACDTVSEEPKWLAMEDLGRQRFPKKIDDAWRRKVARGLAKIHATNLDRGDEMPWLPVADKTYWQTVTTTLSVDHFAREAAQDPAFAARFGGHLPKLRDRAAAFVEDMTALCEEPGCMTLVHGDLQTPNGSHVYCDHGAARIIDFGFCRYAPFYVDLAGWFRGRDLAIYHGELRRLGLDLSDADFQKRADAAARYNGFVYLYPALMHYRQGDPADLLRCLSILLEE